MTSTASAGASVATSNELELGRRGRREPEAREREAHPRTAVEEEARAHRPRDRVGRWRVRPDQRAHAFRIDLVESLRREQRVVGAGLRAREGLERIECQALPDHVGRERRGLADVGEELPARGPIGRRLPGRRVVFDRDARDERVGPADGALRVAREVARPRESEEGLAREIARRVGRDLRRPELHGARVVAGDLPRHAGERPSVVRHAVRRVELGDPLVRLRGAGPVLPALERFPHEVERAGSGVVVDAATLLADGRQRGDRVAHPVLLVERASLHVRESATVRGRFERSRADRVDGVGPSARVHETLRACHPFLGRRARRDRRRHRPHRARRVLAPEAVQIRRSLRRASFPCARRATTARRRSPARDRDAPPTRSRSRVPPPWLPRLASPPRARAVHAPRSPCPAGTRERTAAASTGSFPASSTSPTTRSLYGSGTCSALPIVSTNGNARAACPLWVSAQPCRNFLSASTRPRTWLSGQAASAVAASALFDAARSSATFGGRSITGSRNAGPTSVTSSEGIAGAGRAACASAGRRRIMSALPV